LREPDEGYSTTAKRVVRTEFDIYVFYSIHR
jgi:hypothetical protein